MQETCHTPRTWLAKGCAVFLPHGWMGRAWQRMAAMGLDLGSESVRRTALCGCPAEGARFGFGIGMGKLTRNRGQLMIFRTAWRRSFPVTSHFEDTGTGTIAAIFDIPLHLRRRDPEKREMGVRERTPAKTRGRRPKGECEALVAVESEEEDGISKSVHK